MAERRVSEKVSATKRNGRKNRKGRKKSWNQKHGRGRMENNGVEEGGGEKYQINDIKK